MKELLVHIRPISDFPTVHSDRLFGAICVAIKDLYSEEKLVDLIEKFEKEPPFLLSSIFPYVNHEGGRTYFLPKPIEDIKKINDHKKYIDNYKNIKNVKYISDEIFNSWTNGKIDEAYILKNIDKYKIRTCLLFPKDKKLKFNMVTSDIPRNRINRLNNLSEDIFYFNGKNYDNMSLFFIIRFYDQKYEELLIESLKFLRDYRGFGKDLSVGKGMFEIQEISDNKIIKSMKDNKRFITLSRYIPSIDEINMFRVRKKAYYGIVSKRGMIPGDKPKKQVHFFTEGSTFPNIKNIETAKAIYGKMVCVHEKAVEYGFAFNVGMLYE